MRAAPTSCPLPGRMCPDTFPPLAQWATCLAVTHLRLTAGCPFAHLRAVSTDRSGKRAAAIAAAAAILEQQSAFFGGHSSPTATSARATFPGAPWPPPLLLGGADRLTLHEALTLSAAHSHKTLVVLRFACVNLTLTTGTPRGNRAQME